MRLVSHVPLPTDGASLHMLSARSSSVTIADAACDARSS
jgi:hypothetical protein